MFIAGNDLFTTPSFISDAINFIFAKLDFFPVLFEKILCGVLKVKIN